jgi:glucose/arabinose dehydrogenase
VRRSILIASSLLLLTLAACTSQPTPGGITPIAQPSSTAGAIVAVTDTPINPTPIPPTAIPPTPTLESPPEAASATPSPQGITAFPDPRAYTWELLLNGLERPIAIAEPQDGSGRLFIVEQPGVIRIYQGGTLLSPPFLDIRPRVGSQGNEQGLLGLAFHPAYAQNGLFYVNYTDLNGDSVIARFSVSGSDANRADEDSEQQILFISQPYGNHNGGSVVFGPDGYLYLGLGDGGSAGDPQGNGQSLNTFLGKILRIDIDNGNPYAIPAGNAFSAAAQAEIWAYGLRNPWRFSFDRQNGDVYIADVGQNAWEEVNFLPAGSSAGANFGWVFREGMHPYEGNPPDGAALIDPVAEYNHGQGCSVTGGYVYRGEALPAWKGIYLYGDFCSGIIWGLARNPDGGWMNQVLFESGLNISSFGEDVAGELYLTDLNGGIYRLSAKP